MAISAELQLLAKKQSYGLIGKHSRVKVCHWTKSELTGEGCCYKGKFYGMKSHQCTQMTPSFTCNNACVFCWRDLRYHTAPALEGGIDDPIDVVEQSIQMQRKLLSGYKGNPKVSKQKFEEAMNPKHVAISLDGEPTLYPKLKELIAEYTKRGMSTFLVSNGLMPERIIALKEQPPTQLYISLDAPNEELFMEIDRPIIKNAWQRLMETMDALREMQKYTRTVIRFTLLKGMNMVSPDQWAQVIKKADAQFVEIKGYMWIGMSRERLEKKNMPLHEEVREFAMQVAQECGYEVVDEHVPSRVVLLKRPSAPDKIIDFSQIKGLKA